MQCGSCWAFSAIAPLEFAQCKKTGVPVVLRYHSHLFDIISSSFSTDSFKRTTTGRLRPVQFRLWRRMAHWRLEIPKKFSRWICQTIALPLHRNGSERRQIYAILFQTILKQKSGKYLQIHQFHERCQNFFIRIPGNIGLF